MITHKINFFKTMKNIILMILKKRFVSFNGDPSTFLITSHFTEFNSSHCRTFTNGFNKQMSKLKSNKRWHTRSHILLRL